MSSSNATDTPIHSARLRTSPVRGLEPEPPPPPPSEGLCVVGVGLTDGDGLAEADGLTDGDGLAEADGLTDGDGLAEADGLTDGEALGAVYTLVKVMPSAALPSRVMAIATSRPLSPFATVAVTV